MLERRRRKAGTGRGEERGGGGVKEVEAARQAEGCLSDNCQ